MTYIGEITIALAVFVAVRIALTHITRRRMRADRLDMLRSIRRMERGR